MSYHDKYGGPSRSTSFKREREEDHDQPFSGWDYPNDGHPQGFATGADDFGIASLFHRALLPVADPEPLVIRPKRKKIHFSIRHPSPPRDPAPPLPSPPTPAPSALLGSTSSPSSSTKASGSSSRTHEAGKRANGVDGAGKSCGFTLLSWPH